MNEGSEIETRTQRARLECSKFTAKFADIQPIGGTEVIELQEKAKQEGGNGVILIDVRDGPEQEVSMIRGALTQAQFESNDVYSPENCKDTLIVPYCTIGYRSGKYCQHLRAKGYPLVRNGEGVVMWTHDIGRGLVKKVDKTNADGSIVEEEEEVKRVHVYADAWDFAAEDYEAVKKEGAAFNFGMKIINFFLKT